MLKTPIQLTACIAAVLLAGAAEAQSVARGDRPIVGLVTGLKPGQFVWAPELSAEGPMLLVVNLATQRAMLFRNGVPIAASTVSTGKAGHETPTGVFTILQKRKEHYSNLYDDAPMPNMQRLTWGGVALHAGNLPGYPASHGCIRLPMEFSKLLFDVTALGMTVVITSVPASPAVSQAPKLAESSPTKGGGSLEFAPFEWHPERANGGVVSVVVSLADQRAVVFRHNIEIGSAPVRTDPPLDGTVAYVLQASDAAGRHWLKLNLSGGGQGMEVAPAESGRFDVPSDFRRRVIEILAPGTTIVVTPESLTAGSGGQSLTVIENDER
jgi:hypothetical protein